MVPALIMLLAAGLDPALPAAGAPLPFAAGSGQVSTSAAVPPAAPEHAVPPAPAAPPSVAADSPPAPVMVGGSAAINPRAAELRPIVRAALARLTPAQRPRATVLAAERQVVAGLNYRLRL